MVRYRCMTIASGENEPDTINFHAAPHISRTRPTTNAGRLRARLCSSYPLSTIAAVQRLHLASMQTAVAMLRAFSRLARDDSLKEGPATTHDGKHVDRPRRRARRRGCCGRRVAHGEHVRAVIALKEAGCQARCGGERRSRKSDVPESPTRVPDGEAPKLSLTALQDLEMMSDDGIIID